MEMDFNYNKQNDSTVKSFMLNHLSPALTDQISNRLVVIGFHWKKCVKQDPHGISGSE
jgi:hypothetical protein